jgi:hypothetical protein
MAASKDESKTLFISRRICYTYEIFVVAFYVNIAVCRSRESVARNAKKRNAKRSVVVQANNRGAPACSPGLDLMPLLHSAFMICATL